MSVSRALLYAFDQTDWPLKLLLTALLTFASIIFMPVLFAGLIPLAIVLGYSLDIINNVRDSQPPLLPTWGNYSEYLSRGAKMLPALFLYNLPLVLMSCCLWVIRASIGETLVQGMATLTVLCCLLPLSLLYIAVTWPMLVVGTAKYARSGDSGVFFEFGKLYDAIVSIGSPTIQWFLAALLVTVLLTLVNIIPLIGQAVFCALYIPVQAHLMGQYARLVDRHDPHRKRK